MNKNIYIPHFDKYFYKNKESKLGFGDCIVILNNFLFRYGGSTILVRVNICFRPCLNAGYKVLGYHVGSHIKVSHGSVYIVIIK